MIPLDLYPRHTAIALFGLLTAACAGDPVAGTWAQSDASATLPPSVPVPPDTTLAIDTTWQLEAGTSTVTMDLEAIGLTDSIELTGTYVDEGAALALTFTGFVIAAESENVASVGDDGAQCIVLTGFGGTPVCFPTPQENPFTVEGDTLTVTLDYTVAADTMQTTFTLTATP